MTEQIRIMIVEDHHIVRQGLTALLNSITGMTVVADASDGKTAVTLFNEHRPDVTLMDLRLPQLSGVDAIIAIRKKTSEREDNRADDV